ALFQRLKKIAVMTPQTEVHIRGDEKARYESVGRVIFACQRAAILKISFVTEPPAKGCGQRHQGTPMAMNLSSGGAEPDVMVDINTTPLIDVMLVLLIMLII